MNINAITHLIDEGYLNRNITAYIGAGEFIGEWSAVDLSDETIRIRYDDSLVIIDYKSIIAIEVIDRNIGD